MLELTKELELEILDYYKTHTGKAVYTTYHLTNGKLIKLLDKYNVVPHTKEENKILGRLKAKETCLEKYGAESYSSTKEYKEKFENTMLEKYGVKSAFNLDWVREASEQACLEKYGVKHPLQSKEVFDKTKSTMLEKYGAEYGLQIDSVRDKIKETNVERYGGESPFSSEEVRNKSTETILERYGIEHPLQNSEIKDKLINTNREKYGVDYNLQAESVKEKIKNTNIEKYGGPRPICSDEIKEKIFGTNISKYGTPHPSQTEEVLEKMRITNNERYGVPYTCMRPEARNYSSNDSGPNNLFSSLLDSANISYEKEFPIDKYSYDFKVGSTLIEIDPSFTHNSTFSIFGVPKDKSYHLQKTNTAIENGYRCIHIFDWEDMNKVISLLSKKDRVYARNCEIREVSKQEAKEFIDRYHLQNYAKDGIRLGLYYNNELVSIMTFGKPRYNSNYDYELIRFCSSKNVIGGSEKLFRHFIDDYKPSSIISYCDYSKFSGKTYEKLGFHLDNKPSPSRHWYNIKTNKHITDNLLRQRGYDQLFGTNYGKGTSNEQLMLENGFIEIYDCGQLRYSWNNEAE